MTSALAIYGLTEEIPRKHWIAIKALRMACSKRGPDRGLFESYAWTRDEDRFIEVEPTRSKEVRNPIFPEHGVTQLKDCQRREQ
ncbi:MAG: hypothetical protein RJB38_2386 [Pseudomonadota bacterium]